MFKNYLPLYEKEKLNSYKEFGIVLEEREKVPLVIGQPMRHQELIGNLMKGVVEPVESILLVHDMGTGKSCTAIHSIEQNIRDNVYGMERAIILNRGKAIMNNFINELVFKCTEVYNSSTEKTQKGLWSKFYTFDTFELFVKKIKDLSKDEILKKYNNTFLVIDEVHNILNDESNVYVEISRFISSITNKKILLLTGTPVRDSPEDIVPILNLILPEKINPNNFKTEYYDSKGNLNEKFKRKIFNKVSYLKSSIPEITIKNVGTKIFGLKKFNVVAHRMSDFQSNIYQLAYKKDFVSGGVYTNSRQASRFVFPDGSYGSEGYDKYVNGKKKIFKTIMKVELKKYGVDRDSILKRINELSVKYAYIITKVLEADKGGEKSIVYDDLVKGSGLIVFSMLLDFIGFKKYKLITSETTTTSEISKIQKAFNSDVKGENISVILGSRVIAEGFTFLDVMHEHLVPHWNNTETLQVVARGIRMGSHERLLQLNPNAFVSVYRHVSISNDDPKTSIDYLMTKLSEEKDIEISKIMEAIKESSLTCNAFKRRNGGKCLAPQLDPIDNSNIISSGSLSKLTIENITSYFKIHYREKLKTLVDKLGVEKEVLIKYLHYFINDKIRFYSDKGVECYLNNHRDYYFRTENIRQEDDIYMSIYTEDLKPYTNETPTEMYEKALSFLEDKDSNANIQRLIELAVTIKMYNLKSNRKVVDEILHEFSDFWKINNENKEAVVWYHSAHEKAIKPMCLINPYSDKPWLEWGKCSKEIKKDLTNNRLAENKQFEDSLREKNINYYGLVNPETKEFCIKKIRADNNNKDKRKIASGKRCENWQKNELLQIAKTELGENQDWDTWYLKNRKDMCENMKELFKYKQLLVENKSCGVQTKRKI